MTEKIKIGGILVRNNLCMMEIIGVDNISESAAKIFHLFGKYKASLEFISESRTSEGMGSITVCLSSKFCQLMEKFEKKILTHIFAKNIFRHPQVVMISIYGPHFGEVPSIAGYLCQALSDSDIDIHGISTAINSITCVIDSSDLSAARSAMDTMFQTPE